MEPMKKYLALVFIIVGAALVIDQVFGILAGAHSDSSAHGTPAGSLIAPFILVLVGVKWRQS